MLPVIRHLLGQDGAQALPIINHVLKTDKLEVHQFEHHQAWICVPPAAAQVCPDAVSQDLGQGTLGILPRNGHCLGVQHPVNAGILVGCHEAQRLHQPQTKFILAEAVVSIQNGPQYGAPQEADREEVVKVARLERRVLPVVREAQKFALLRRDAAALLIHPLQHSGHQKGGGRTPAFTG